jgi:alkylation response protein AidB-like acyl-CoA dehydrogenase
VSSATELDHLRRMARRLIQDETGISDLRRLRDSKSPAGYDRDLWQKMVHLGWAGIVIPERFGGAGLG